VAECFTGGKEKRSEVIMILDFFRLSINNLKHRKRRSWLTIIGTLIGIMAVVSLISIGQGLENSVQSELEELGGNKVFIEPGGGVGGRFSDTTFELTDDDLEAVRRVQAVEDAAGLISGNKRATFRRETESITVTGLPTGEQRDTALDISGITVEDGRYIRSTDNSNIIIEEDAAKETFENEEVVLGTSISINNSDYSVEGIYSTSDATTGIGGIVMPLDQARDVLGKSDEYDQIVAVIDEGFDPGEAAEDIRANLRNERGLEEGEEDFQVRTADDIIRSFNNQLSIIRTVLLGIGGISLLVGGIGITNTMYTSVTERTREIGVMKAVGATKKQILGLFMIESGMVGMIGGILGATVGIAISYIAAYAIQQTVSIPFTPFVSIELILGSVFFSFIVGMISGVLPARKASKKQPVEALRFE